MANLIGQELGGYQIAEQIGQGGMATVYKAYEAATDRYVALKILPHQYSHDAKFIERFRREARALAKLEHIHILPIHAYGEQDGIIYLAMRYIPTGSLKDRIQQQGALPLQEANRLLGQIAGALDHAHQHGILHRDVKPANVLLDADGNAYLTDFGIARMVGATADLTGGGIIGTPAYMPPEQLEENAEIVPASDQYALGIVLYEMVTGRTPYQAETPVALITKKLTAPLPPPGAFTPTLPEAAEHVILKALANDPAVRFQSCCELADQFAAALDGMPVDIQLPPASPDDMTFDSLPGASALAPTAAPAPPTVAPQHGMPAWMIGLITVLGIIVIGGALFFGLRGTADLDPTQVLAIAQQATQTGEAVRAATRTQSAAERATELAAANATANAEATIIALTPSATPEPTITPTPILLTDTGMPLFDDFEDEAITVSLWTQNPDWHSVIDGELIFSIPQGQAFDAQAWKRTLRNPVVEDSGPVRLAVEARIKVDSGAANSNVGLDVFINLSWSGDWYYGAGYQIIPSLRFFCHLNQNSSGNAYYANNFGNPGYDEWHTFRTTVEEIPGSDDLAIRSYIDGEPVCDTTPPADMQAEMIKDGAAQFALGNYWRAPWDLSNPFQAYYDDIAIGIPVE